MKTFQKIDSFLESRKDRGLSENEDVFGESISLFWDGKTAAIKAAYSDTGGKWSGHVEVYNKTKDSTWKPKGSW